MWRGLRPFIGSAKIATVAPWPPRKYRSHGMRRAACYSTISMTIWVITVTVHQTIVSHGSTTSRRPPALAFLLMAAFDFRRQLVLNGTHAEYGRIDALKL
jgi:hypothetical protein